MHFFLVFLLFFLPLAQKNALNASILPKGAVHEGDYFSSGTHIKISGVVNGDVYAFGSAILIDGHIEGDVIAFGSTIEISGEVEGNARVGGGQINIEGVIGRSLTAMGGNIHLDQKAHVKGNAVFTGGVVDFAGKIDGSVTLTGSNVRLAGEINGDVQAYVGNLILDKGTNIGGNLKYSSKEKAIFEPGIKISGKTEYNPSNVPGYFKGEWKKSFIIGSKVAGMLMNFFFSFVIGWILIKAFPRNVEITVSHLRSRPWKALWWGILIAILLPIFCLFLFITILGIPLAIALLAFTLLGFYTAKIFPIIWISKAVLPGNGLRKNALGVFTLGLIVFLIISHIPFVGGLFSMIFTFLGLGAVMMGRITRYEKI